MRDLAAKKAEIFKMFEGFPSSQITKGTIDAYAETVSPFSLEAVRRACARYRAGGVPDQNRTFAPSSAELTHQCQLFDDGLAYLARAKHDKEKLISYPLGSLPPPPAVPLGPLTVDFGAGPIDMRDMTAEQKEEIFANKGLPPSDRRDRLAKIKRMDG